MVFHQIESKGEHKDKGSKFNIISIHHFIIEKKQFIDLSKPYSYVHVTP